MKRQYLILIILVCLCGFVHSAMAQELQVKITINSSQVEGSDKAVFENTIKQSLI